MLEKGRGSRKNVFPPAWLKARELVMGPDAAATEEVLLLVELLDRGGELLSWLQELVDSPALIPGSRDEPWAALLDYIDDDLTDLFRSAAAGAANLIPGASLTEDADPPEVKADIIVLGRYLTIALLAAAHPSVPIEVRHAFVDVGRAIRGWDRRTVRVIEQIERRYHRLDETGRGQTDDV